MKTIYIYNDETKAFLRPHFLGENETAPTNSTDVAPVAEDGSGLYEPKWNGTSWDSLTAEEYLKKHPITPEPTDDQQFKATMTKSVMALTKDLKQANDSIANQQKINATLTKQIMSLKLKGENTNV